MAQHKCEDCKDTGFIILLTSRSACDCQREKHRIDDRDLHSWMGFWGNPTSFHQKP